MHLSFFHALILAVLQGITELFPVSSLAHGVIIPDILGWKINRQAEGFLPFLVVLHIGTALALLIYFYKDWINLFKGFFAGLKSKNPSACLLIFHPKISGIITPWARAVPM